MAEIINTCFHLNPEDQIVLFQKLGFDLSCLTRDDALCMARR
jgi:hypothetical protein